MSIENAKIQMGKMLDWYENVKIPFSEIRVNNFSVITNVKKYIETNISRVKNQPILSLEWRLAYMRLYELKSIITNYDNKL